MPAGVPALSVAPGVVRVSKEIKTGGYIVVDHANGLSSQYMHLFNRRVTVGQSVQAGAILADVGFNPRAYKLIHLHFQLRQDGKLIDPRSPLRSMSVVSAPSSQVWLGAAASIAAGLAVAKYVFV